MVKQKKPVVVVTRRLPDAIQQRMQELFDVRLNANDKPMTAAELAWVQSVIEDLRARRLSPSASSLRAAAAAASAAS